MISKILIVEDDLMLGEIYQEKFSDAGYDVSIATKGPEALGKIKEECPELVLLDLVLPGEDGFDVLKEISEKYKSKGLRIITLSNLFKEDDREKAIALGADAFLTKSDHTPTEMINEVGKIIKGFIK